MSKFSDTVSTARISAAKKIGAKVRSSNLGTTTNGAVNYKSTLNKCLDFFFNISAFRKSSPIAMFDAAFNEDPELAVRVMLYARDIRGGARERSMFRQLLAHIDRKDSDLAIMICTKVPELGRWDDLLSVQQANTREFVYAMFAQALNDGNGLAAKWCPREKTARASDREFANGLRKYMNLSARDYRKLLVKLTNVVESDICAKQYQNIDYSKLPSLAANRYSGLFKKNDPVRYQKYLDDLTKGTDGVKVNASTLFPYDVLRQSDRALQDAQWAALPNFAGSAKILPMVDTSGSMSSLVSGGSLSCRDVAYSLGMYFADKLQGEFEGMIMTFSESPKLFKLPKTNSVRQKLEVLNRYSIIANTDIERGFNCILQHAKDHKVPQEDMPDYLYIFSDMQFDEGVSGSYRTGNNTTHERMEKMFSDAGYKLPQVVFWNIRATAGSGAPVTVHKTGTALVSGFSPDIAKVVMQAKNMTPMSILLDAVMVDRYNIHAE